MPRSSVPVSLAVYQLPRRGWSEIYCTATPAPGGGAEDVAACYRQLADVLASHRAEVVGERVYGALQAENEILAARDRELRARGLDPKTPCNYLEGAPCDGGIYGGTQVWAIARSNGSPAAVETVPGGRLVAVPDGRLLHLTAQRGEPGAPFARAAESMFTHAAALAERSGFRYAQAARTWIYLADLLPNYAELNRVRSAFYQRIDFAWPASTGIQGKPPGAPCVMDALLVDGVPLRRIDRTSRQGPASDYGSAFSRAMLLEFAGGRTLHVSGTASIGGDGRSRHLGDPTAQYLEMLLDVAAVLAEAQLGLADVVQATLFCKTAAVRDACVHAHRLLGLPALPAVVVRADVCRPELLVELEAVACR